jgi:hypothetical protein
MPLAVAFTFFLINPTLYITALAHHSAASRASPWPVKGKDLKSFFCEDIKLVKPGYKRKNRRHKLLIPEMKRKITTDPRGVKRTTNEHYVQIIMLTS